MMHGTDAECLDFGSILVLALRVLRPLSSMNTIPILGYVTTALLIIGSKLSAANTAVCQEGVAPSAVTKIPKHTIAP